MSGVITPLYYLPPIHCMALYLDHRSVILESNENYQKGSFRNKCQIGTAQGPIMLSIPLRRGKHQALGIKNVLISNVEDWQSQHWKSIKTAYSNTPYFEHYDYLFEQVYKEQYELLWDFNVKLLDVVIQCIGGGIAIAESAEYIKTYPDDVVDLRREKKPSRTVPAYPQVHEAVVSFQSDMSILDLIFHLGPEARTYLKNI